FAAGMEQYLFTMGILISFLGMLIGIYYSRKQIRALLQGYGINARRLALSFLVLAVFIGAELTIVKPTQQLFFDDTIYQDMALNLIHMGQAFMCNYGSASACISGSAFHEPIGTAFILAIGFAAAGLGRATAYATMFVVSMLAVYMTFLVALLFSKKFEVAIFSEFIMALTPVVLVWAYPTTSDMPMLAFSLVAIFFTLVFIEKRSMATFFTALMGISFLTYMKIDGVVYLVVIPIVYLILSDRSILDSIRNNMKRLLAYWLDTRFLIAILVFIIAIGPEVGFAANELVGGSFGYQGAYVENTCAASFQNFVATKPIDLRNFEANICSNLAYWVNQYSSADIIQPLAFTALAIIGIALMLAMGYKRQLLAIAVWFGAFFVLYAAFYAGGVLYGVDWRFMLALSAQASILGGFAIYGIKEAAKNTLGGSPV
ncbi:glycosyltransferase family 39 protein, partial [Candidatus Marsarchaeota archaeon]|nr:glycosyltransferase family 39 protein [Candidatus Marsarchaeota archaeon]